MAFVEKDIERGITKDWGDSLSRRSGNR